jgi:hypothetical protein
MALTVREEAMLHARIGGIPGCRLRGIEAIAATGHLVLDVDGWSAALYRHRMRWVAAESPWGGVDDVLRQIEDRLATQERRSEAGIVWGTALPFPLEQQAHPPMVDHLHMDLSQIALLMRTRTHNGRSPRDMVMAEVVTPLRRLHAKTDHGHVAMGDDDVSMADGCGVSMVAVRHRIVHGGSLVGRPAIFGDRVEMKQVLPESAVAAAVGRRVDEIIETDPIVGRRRVVRATTHDDGTDLTLDGRIVRLGDVVHLWKRDAMDRLTAMLEDAA